MELMDVDSTESSVKEGYKQTEFGEIPNDWLGTTFGEVLTGFSSGMTPYRGNPEFYKGNIKWITSGELKYKVITDTKEKITLDAVIKTNLKILPKGTFLMAITGLEAAGTRGSCGITGVEATTNQSCMALFPTSKITTEYLYHFYVRYGNELAFRYCQGTKQQSYTARITKLLPINLPPTLEEQGAIANALSDVDTLINNLNKLITKKQAIKQGAMQKLLSGRKRFNICSLEKGDKETEFGDIPIGWKVKQIKDVAPLQRGFDLPNSQLIKGDHPVVYSNGIGNYHANYMAKGPGVVTGRSGTLGKVTYVENDYYPHNTSLWVTDFKGNYPLFIYYLFQHIKLDRFGTGSGVPTLNRNDVHAFKVLIPSDIEEQKCIATALHDMDLEIKSIQIKKSKYQRLKQGMMQELLTGKTRLV